MMSNTKTGSEGNTIITGFGKVDAVSCKRFVTAYSIKKTDRGVLIDGSSPDGRLTATCDRCGTAITYVYVFANGDRTMYMHVGIDCASKMGLDLTELKAARGYWRELAREQDRAARALSAKERREAEQKAIDARLAASAELVAMIESLQAHPAVTQWERDQLAGMIARTGHNGDEWFYDAEPDTSDAATVAKFFAIQQRLGLCDSSKPFTTSAKRVTLKLRAYRAHLAFQSMYGTTCISFLCDEETGTAFVYKGSKAVHQGEIITATWSVADTDTRDGLTSTHLKRPAKGTVIGTDGQVFEF